MRKKRKRLDVSCCIVAATRIQRWWGRVRRLIPTNDADPISLDPLCHTRMFRVVDGTTVTGYDASKLSAFIEETGDTRLPSSRRKLHLCELMRLDRTNKRKLLCKESIAYQHQSGALAKKMRAQVEYEDFVDAFRNAFEETLSCLYEVCIDDVLACIEVGPEFDAEAHNVVLDFIIPLMLVPKSKRTRKIAAVLSVLDETITKFKPVYHPSWCSCEDDDCLEDVEWFMNPKLRSLPPPKVCRGAVATLSALRRECRIVAEHESE